MASADPTASIIFFLILTLAYSIFKYYTKSPSMLKIWTGIYFLVLINMAFRTITDAQNYLVVIKSCCEKVFDMHTIFMMDDGA